MDCNTRSACRTSSQNGSTTPNSCPSSSSSSASTDVGRRVRLTLAESRAFTYWLFKRRILNSDQARVASDTRKGLRMLNELRERARID